MLWLCRFRIGTRLGAAFGSIIVLLLAICAYGALITRSLATDLKATATFDLARMDHATALDKAAGVIARASRELLLLETASGFKKQRELIAKSFADSGERFEKLQALGGDPSLLIRIEAVRSGKDAFTKATTAYLATLDSGSPDDARRALLVDLRPVQANYEKALLALTESAQHQAAERASAGQRLAESGLATTIVLGSIALVLAAGAAWLIARSITRPLSQAIATARSIRDGDLSCGQVLHTADELGDLLAAIADMQTNLTQVIQDVNRAARDVATSSDQIAHGNADLSNRTERASSNLQQTVSAMDQIAVTVAGSSQKSQQASEVANKARSAVIDGGRAVEGLVDTMSRIAESSHRIKDILGVIDGIAFQTNILALNAAVEAARAGENGRGFAVVAGEVRTLAARAGAAAKEIKVLIDDSVDKVRRRQPDRQRGGQAHPRHRRRSGQRAPIDRRSFVRRTAASRGNQRGQSQRERS